MDKQQRFRTEFLTLCDEYDINAEDVSIKFMDAVFAEAKEIIADQVEPEVKHEIAENIIKQKTDELEELAEQYKNEGDIESYTDCLSRRNTLESILTEIEKQFPV